MSPDPIPNNAAPAASAPLLYTKVSSAPAQKEPAPTPAPTAPTAPTAADAPSVAELADQVRKAVEESNRKLQAANVSLSFQFEVNAAGELRSVKLMDSVKNQVVMQFPSEEMLAVRANVDQMIAANEKTGSGITGVLFSKIA